MDGATRIDRERNEADEQMRALYDAHAPSLLRTLVAWTQGDRFAAEDLLQETMLRAWRHLPAIEDRTVRPWLLTIARRLAIDVLRSRAARPAECGDEPLGYLAHPHDHVERIVDRVTLSPALARLPAAQRTVLVHLYYLHSTMRQTAEELGIPEGTVKTRTRRALQTLRTGLAP